MRTRVAIPLGMLLAAIVGAGAVAVYVRVTHLTARAVPGPIETSLARAARRLAVPGEVKRATNPVPSSPEALADGMAHFADHCASCHANNGSGDTEMGRGFFPPAPDMRAAATQDLSDGELFYIIENGIRFTGMPGWSTGTAAGTESSWRLVHFIRHLPALTDDELERMESANPRSPEAIRQEIEAEKFLKGVQ
jgi:mono/diheme cytochrome c family protein